MIGAGAFVIYRLLDFAHGLLSLLQLVIFIWVILSWLVAFDVVNGRNMTVRRISGFLDQLVMPMLRPFQRFIPSMGAVDLSPMALLFSLWFCQVLIEAVVSRRLLG